MYGDFNSPTFGVASFVSLVTKKAIESTAKSYLLKTFVPYAEVISMTISAGGFILKTRFEDLEFEPNTYELVDSQSTYMQQFIALMKEKENTQVKICATSTSIDLKASELVFESDKEATDFLAELAGLRMKAFKSHSVNNGIDSSRLLLCAPKINLSDDSKPSISISV